MIPNRLRRIIFDLETDGLLDELTKIHSLVIRDIDEPNYVVSCCDQPGHPTIATGLKLLAEAEMVIGHNIIGFDLPAIRKLHPGYKVRKAYDTLVAARLMDPDVKTDDYRRVNFPGKLIGSHSLKAWGYRLDVLKGSYGETQDWSVWTPEMQRYCEQDTKVCQSLLRYQMNLNWSPSSITLEHDFARLIGKQEHNGFGFDLPGATTLYAELVDLREKLTASLQNDFPPRVLVMKTPAYYEDTNTKILYARKKDAPAGAALVAGPMREKLMPFEPGSRHQAAERLIEHGWKPDEFTETGLPKVDDETLSRCVIPQARDLARYFLISKRIGQLAEGQEGWIGAVRDGRIHGRVNTNGAITGRCTHSRPNVAQTPSVKTARGHDGREAMLLGEAGGWGCEMRGLWRPTRPGWVQVGADASGLELRCMAHFLHPYDNGVYREMVTTKVDGMDVHSQNRNTFGLAPTKEGRNRAKTGIYCLIYGGGDEELGRALVGLDSEHEAPARLLAVPGWAARSMARRGPVTLERARNWRRGRYARDRMVRGLAGYAQLSEAVANKAKLQGWLRGLDGRKLPVRKAHAALNLIFQSAGSLLVKAATVNMETILENEGLLFGEHWALMAHIHDEIQAEAANAWVADRVGRAFVEGLVQAGDQFNFRCKLDGEYKVGGNWAETH